MAIVFGISNDYLINSPGISTSTQKYSLWAKARKDGNRFLNPSLDLNFAENKSLIDDVSGSNLVTFSRSSNATVVNADGLVGIATTNTPRFDHDPITRECKGLLIEEQRINYASQSLVAVNSTLVSSNDTTYNVGTDVTTIHKFTLGTAGVQFYIPTFSAPGVGSAGLNDVISFYMRSDSPLTVSFNPDLSVISNTGMYFSNGTTINYNYSLTTTPGPSGFTRYTILTNSLSANGNAISRAQITLSGTSGTNYYIFGCQWESRVSFPTSYIPTSGSAVTRTADSSNITGTNFSRWYSDNKQGSLYSEFSHSFSPALVGGGIGFSANNNQPWIGFSFAASTITSALRGTAAGLTSFNNISRPSFVSDYLYKIVMSYIIDSNDKGVLQGGAQNTSSFSGFTPTANNMTGISQFNIGTQYVSGSSSTPSIHIRRTTYWNSTLSNTQWSLLTQ